MNKGEEEDNNHDASTASFIEDIAPNICRLESTKNGNLKKNQMHLNIAEAVDIMNNKNGI